jgi:hypothetical protein
MIEQHFFVEYSRAKLLKQNVRIVCTNELVSEFYNGFNSKSNPVPGVESLFWTGQNSHGMITSTHDLYCNGI